MKREPSVSHRWWTKWFFPRLLATEAYRYIFRNSKRRISPATAQNITHALSLLYVLTAGTAAGIGKNASSIIFKLGQDSRIDDHKWRGSAIRKTDLHLILLHFSLLRILLLRKAK